MGLDLEGVLQEAPYPRLEPGKAQWSHGEKRHPMTVVEQEPLRTAHGLPESLSRAPWDAVVFGRLDDQNGRGIHPTRIVRWLEDAELGLDPRFELLLGPPEL